MAGTDYGTTVSNASVEYIKDSDLKEYTVTIAAKQYTIREGENVMQSLLKAGFKPNPTKQSDGSYKGWALDISHTAVMSDEFIAKTDNSNPAYLNKIAVQTSNACTSNNMVKDGTEWTGSTQKYNTSWVGNIGTDVFKMKSTFTSWATESSSVTLANSRFQGAGFAIRQLSTGKIIQITPDFTHGQLAVAMAGVHDKKIGTSYNLTITGGNGWRYRRSINTYGAGGKPELGKDLFAYGIGEEGKNYAYDMQVVVDGYNIKVWIGAVGTKFDDALPNFDFNYYTWFKDRNQYASPTAGWAISTGNYILGVDKFPFFMDTYDGLFLSEGSLACVGFTSMGDGTAHVITSGTEITIGGNTYENK